MKINRTRQTVTGLVIAAAIAGTLLCGVMLALAENQSAVSALPTPTVYHIPTLLPSSQPTRPGSATPAPTVVIIPSANKATSTAGQSPTSRATATPTLTVQAPRGSCQPRTGWSAYRVQPGDTLFLIGWRYGLTVASIMSANCLDQTTIRSGDVIFVPPVTPRPLPEDPIEDGLPTDPPPTGTQTATDGACTNPDSVISAPKVGAALSGHVRIIGTARVPNFAFYKVEIRQEGSGQPYANLHTGHQEVTHGLLAELDTAIFPIGEHWLRLVVVDSNGNYPERCAILVTLLN